MTCGREQVDYFQIANTFEQEFRYVHTISYLNETKLIRELKYISLVLY